MKFATKPIRITHLTIGMLLHYRGKLQIQIFCRCGRKRKQIAFLIASNFVIHPQMLIFLVFKVASLSALTANKYFDVTVLLLIYFCDQFVALEIRHITETSLQCLSTINMVFSYEDKILIKKMYLKGTQQRGWQTNFLRKAQSVV